MYSLTFRVQDDATPFLRSLQLALHEDKLKPVLGRAGVNTFRTHLRQLDRERPNEAGGRRTHFYARAARSTNFRNIHGGVEISVNEAGYAQRYFGGVIRPVNASALAIPNRSVPEAHGKRPREFTNLRLSMRGKHAVLEERAATTLRKTRKGFAKGKQTGGRVFFWLVDEVDQDPDPSVAPTDDEIYDAAEEAIGSWLDRRAA